MTRESQYFSGPNSKESQSYVSKVMANAYGMVSPHMFEMDFVLPKVLSEYTTKENIVDRIFRNVPIEFRGNLPIKLPSSKFTMDILNFSLESMSFPGRGHSTTPKKIAGPVREMPYESLYEGDIQMTFKIGRNYYERNFFEIWMNNIVDSTSRYAYYNDYTTTMNINALDRFGKIVYTCEIQECFPKAISNIDYSHVTVDEFVRFTVNMSYRKYRISYANGQELPQQETLTTEEQKQSDQNQMNQAPGVNNVIIGDGRQTSVTPGTIVALRPD